MRGDPLKILLINVALRPNSPVKYLPLGLAYIATAIKRAGYEFDILDIDARRLSDEEVSEYLASHEYDVVCMGCIVTGYAIIKKMASKLRSFYPSSTIVVGNSVADSIPKALLKYTDADVAVLGEGDITIVDLLNRISSGKDIQDVKGIAYKRGDEIVFSGPRPCIKDLVQIPFIDYSMWDVEEYIKGVRESIGDPAPLPKEQIRGMVINTARGCVGRCTFCYHVFRDVPYRHRPWKDVLAEVKLLVDRYNVNYIGFYDELTFSSKRSVREFIDERAKSGIKFFWIADCRADLFTDEADIDLIMLLKESGCVGMGYSLESSNPEILKAMNKNITVDEFSLQTYLFRKAGIPAWTSLVFGYPQETPATIKDTIDCCVANQIYPSAGFLLPFPGSEMFDCAIEKGVIDPNNLEEYLNKLGDRQDLRFNLTGMSNEELERVVDQQLKRCSEALKIGLADDQLRKTQYYRTSETGDKVE